MAESKRGGKRPGAGRKKGAVSVKTRAIRARTEAAIEAVGETPLEYMLRVMRTSNDDKRRDAMAVAAAPFVHPRLTSIDGDLNLNIRKHEEALDDLA
jgi:hypothetical protein